MDNAGDFSIVAQVKQVDERGQEAGRKVRIRLQKKHTGSEEVRRPRGTRT